MRETILSLQEEDKPIIVEGKKDLRSLHELGITNCLEIQGPLYLFAEKTSATTKKVILLLDTDKEGIKLTKMLVKELQKNKVKVELKYWHRLFDLKVSHVEGLGKLIRNIGGV